MQRGPLLSKRAFGLLFGVSMVTTIGNTGMHSVMPAIGRSLQIPDPMVAAIFSLSGLLWSICSPVWARASDRHGRKPLILLGMAAFTVSGLLCALVVAAGQLALTAPMTTFVLFLLARGLFGMFGSASNPAAQAYVAERTPPAERTQAMASLAGAIGMGTVIGPFLAPLFVLPGVRLAGPLLAFCTLGAVMVFLVWRYLPEGEGAASLRPLDSVRPKMRGLAALRDPRLAPFLAYGFLLAACQNAQVQTLGFLIIDKLGLDPIEAQGFIAIAMMFGAVAGMLAQWGIIRTFSLTPRQLLRWGVAIGAAGNLVVALSPDYWTVVAGYALASLGFGLARPGYTAGSSLAVDMHEQGRVAGYVAGVTGISILFAPLFVLLYQHAPAAPFLLNAAILLGLVAYAFQNRQLRNADPRPTTEEDATRATLEKSDEGGTL